MTLEEKWQGFSDEELLALHIGLIQLSADAQLVLWDMGPGYELCRRHDISLEKPLDPIGLLAQYPVLEQELNNWLRRRVRR